ncbi:class II aldolase/adducin family protein [Gluconacetobacter azotocaptans]|uniref:Class II aldolase/adducin family protein n=1 Tax=Gluconacetobacter azotocaptans TaxID=142834 RepID=A0A7W4JV84_9PROT|nr:class II aldolase/adducin family protein [Gluconacetobacter azotocaptans]MBB2191435.1 class II aldolase/adducin family protein [Gluconacetobacter azotocaptans]GBQ29671.1 ribulose-5-phosphate 4-epimerase [Gluconacetobacter azotocaptans DSM 13594]
MAWNNLPIDPAGLSIRQELAAIFRILAHFRMTDLIHTHASARVPDKSNTLLINRYNLLFDEVTASSLIEIDESGALSPEYEGADINDAGCNIHSAIHEALPDVGVVIHTHTRAGAAVSAQRHGLLPISQQAMMFHGAVGYHEFEGFVLSQSERASLVRDLGNHKAVILRNHGLIAVGSTAAEAWNRIYNIERACEIQVAALAGGSELVVPPEAIQTRMGQQAVSDKQLYIERMAWNACLRLIENVGTDFRL